MRNEAQTVPNDPITAVDEFFHSQLPALCNNLRQAVRVEIAKIQEQRQLLDQEIAAFQRERAKVIQEIENPPALAAVQVRRDSFQKMKSDLMEAHATDGDIVVLNVGGKKVTTTRTTLAKFPNSFLAMFFRGMFPVTRDAQGRIFLDRNHTHFEILLDFLRTGEVPPLSGDAEYMALQFEAEFWGVPLPVQGKSVPSRAR